MLRSSFWRRLRVALMAGLLVGGLGGALAYWRPLDGPEFWVYDRLAPHAAAPLLAQEPVAVVALDDLSVEQVRRDQDLGWPWPRELIGRGVEELAKLGAKVIVLDFPFSDSSPAGTADELQFVAHLQAATPVVVAAQLTDKDTLGTIPRGRWAALIEVGATPGEVLGTAAALSARGNRSYLVQTPGRTELWVGGFRAKTEAEQNAASLAHLLNLDRPGAARELTAKEMDDPVGAEDWMTTRDAIDVKGAEALALPNAETWVLPRPEVAAAASRVGVGQGTAGAGRDGTDAADDDEIDNDDLDPPRTDVARAVRLMVRHGDRLYPTLGLAALLAGANRPLAVDATGLQYGDQHVPLNRRGQMYVTYPRRSAFSSAEYDFVEVPFVQLLNNAARRDQHLPPEPRLEQALRGKYVVIANRVSSAGATVQKTLIPEMPYGAAVVAATLRTLLLGSAVARAPRAVDGKWAIGLGLLGALFAFAAFRGTRSVLVTLILGVGGTGFGVWLYIAYVAQRFSLERVWQASFYPALAFAMGSAVTAWVNFGDEALDRQRVIEALGRLTSSAVVDRILKAPHLLAPERRALTTCFVGLIGFGKMAEALPARRLGELMGQVFGALGDQVRSHRGHLAQLVGDRLFAIWNAPLPLEHHARFACQAALAMRDRLEKLRPALKQEFSIDVRAGIGIATGEAVVGELGARASGGAEKSNYTALGVPVGLASELERVCRLFDVAVVASESTYAAEPEAFAWRELDSVRLGGREDLVRVFELQAEKGRLSVEAAECARLYGMGLAAYRARTYRVAFEHFRGAHQALPTDGASAIMRDRCERLLDAPPPALGGVVVAAPEPAPPAAASDLKAAGR